MKTLSLLASGVAFVAGIGIAAVVPLGSANAEITAPEETRVPMPKGGSAEQAAKSDAQAEDKEPEAKADADEAESKIADADTEESKAVESEADDPAEDAPDETPSETSEEEDKPMSDEAAGDTKPEETEEFRQTMREGDIALGVCGARVSALLWFYEASVAQGRDDLKPAVASLTESRASIKAEAERRAVDDGIDTSVRVMNTESEKIWNDLNEKAAGEAEEFQTAHDELFSGVQECLALFFERPEGEKPKE